MKVNWNNAFQIEQRVAAIIAQQELNGWLFDIEGAKRKIDYLIDLRSELYEKIRPSLRQILDVPYNTPINRPFLKNGNYNRSVISWFDSDNDINNRWLDCVGGPFTRIKYKEPNLDSPDQLKQILFELGWKPTEWNYKKDKKGKFVKDESGGIVKTSPKLTEDSYDSLKIDIGPDVALYLKAGHRLSQLIGLLGNVRSDGRIPAKANPLGTPTGRMRHSIVVNIPKNKSYVFFGKEMRELFIVPDDKLLCGHDASGLEARVFGHFLNDSDLIKSIISGSEENGDDFHTVFWGPLKEFVASRDNAKNVEYAYLYGAGDAKLGHMADYRPKKWSPERTGKAMRKIIEEGIPALGALTDRVKRAAKRGYLIGMDGRKLFVRSSHAALNTLFQGTGAIIMKMSIILLDDSVKKEGLDVLKVGDFHDEGQNEVWPKESELFGKLAVESIVKSGEHFNLNCPLDASYKLGKNWAETH